MSVSSGVHVAILEAERIRGRLPTRIEARMAVRPNLHLRSTMLLLATHVLTAAITATVLLKSAMAAMRATCITKAHGAAWSVRLLAEVAAGASIETRRLRAPSIFGRLRAAAPTQVPAGRSEII